MSVVNVGAVTNLVKIVTIFTCVIQLGITNCLAEPVSKRVDMYSDTVVSFKTLFFFLAYSTLIQNAYQIPLYGVGPLFLHIYCGI